MEAIRKNKMTLKMVFNEKIDIKKAEMLLSLSGNGLEKILWDDEVSCGNGIKDLDKKVYLKRVNDYLKLSISLKGDIEQSYKHSESLVDSGRVFVNLFGVQSLKKRLRGYLVKDFYNDYDMKNAHPTILLYLSKRFFPKFSFPQLDDYVNNRDEFLKKYNIDKTTILVALNSKGDIFSKEPNVVKLDMEFKQLQNLFFNDTPSELSYLEIQKKKKTNNPKGSFINKVLCVFEDKILNVGMSLFQKGEVAVPMFDGFLIDKELDEVEAIKKLDVKTKEYGIKWVCKEHDDYILRNIDGFEKGDYEMKTYEDVKERFEKNNFMIQQPVMYGRTTFVGGIEDYFLYSSSDFKELHLSETYESVEMFRGSQVIRVKDFVNEWKKDKNKRTYKNIDFIPSKLISKETYNTFKGFDYDDNDFKMNEEVVKTFENHISFITNHDEDSKNYVLNYFAHLIQKPYLNPKEGMLFKSIEGMGKDVMIDIIEKIIGDRYVHRTADIDDVFGTFNEPIKNKLILQLNELDGKDGFANSNQLKHLITAEKVNINGKGDKKYFQSNYMRIIIFSNNLNPIKISTTDRRFQVFECNREKPTRDYFDKLFAIPKCENSLKNIFHFLNNRDIENYSPDVDRVITEAYKNMRDNDVNPLFLWLRDVFESGDYKKKLEKADYLIHKSGDVLIKSNRIMNYYRDYLTEKDLDYVKMNFKLVKDLLNSVNVVKKQYKVKGVNNDYYRIDIEDLKTQLKINIGEDETEEVE